MNNINDFCVKIEPVGSRITCCPPPMDTDEDFLILCALDKSTELFNELLIDGYELGGSRPYSEDPQCAREGFSSFTKGTTNYIITCDPQFFDRFMQATAECMRLNLMEKMDRIAMFQRVLYGNETDVFA